MTKRQEIHLRSELFGKALELFIAMELRAYLSYRSRKGFYDSLCYWRTKNGYEVDFVVGEKLALEVKAGRSVTKSDCKGIKMFSEEIPVKQKIIVCTEPLERRIEEDIIILPVQVFLKKLWNDEIIL